ncbi:class I SAM-dependent methyltransferase [Clostridium sp. D33t1_170424_F3]|uniref:class I SAM-dependent methyltransferase n=1 Tax=Clostridium sp. D33t1_170424_F3 TaxID=2787099 RepID=UPI0018AC499F|nr:class I SAM-dependent methyltransferase [Clostridium sp. D33t1_170424_F3]
MDYQNINAETIDQWVKDGWTWGIPVSHEECERAARGDWSVVLTPNKAVPMDWFGSLKGKKVLGLASGGGQQMPLFAAAGANCTVFDYSEKQLESERMVADREGYDIQIIRADMTKPLPFADESFDLIFHPVSNCYVEQVKPIFRECYRVLKDGGVLLAGFDNGVNYLFDNDEKMLLNTLPFNPLQHAEQMKQLMETNSGVQFSHTLDEQIGGQLEAGFILTHIQEDTNEEGNLKEHNVPTYVATRAVKRNDLQPCRLL